MATGDVEEAQRRLARLHVVYAWQIFLPGLRPGRGGEPGSDAQRGTPEAARWLAGLIAPWRQKYPAVEVTEDSVHASPSRVLVGASARADLVVIGRHIRHHGRPGPGSVRNALLSHAHGPVVVVPS